MITIADETGITKDGEIFLLEQELAKLKREIEVLRLYGNDDCTAMADEVLKKEALGE